MTKGLTFTERASERKLSQQPIHTLLPVLSFPLGVVFGKDMAFASGRGFGASFFLFKTLNSPNASLGVSAPIELLEVRVCRCCCPAGVVNRVGRIGARPGTGVGPAPLCCISPTDAQQVRTSQNDKDV